MPPGLDDDRPRPRPPQPQGSHRAAEPVYGRRFDPWNAVSLGHQRAETAGPLGWRDSRAAKLRSQFRAGHGGGEPISDTVGAGGRDFDPRIGALVPDEVRARAATSVLDMLRGSAAKDGLQLPKRRRPGLVAPPRASSAAAVPRLPQPPSLSTSVSAPAPASSSASIERAAPRRISSNSSSKTVSDPFGYGVQSAPPSPSRARAATTEEALAAQRRAEDEACEQDMGQDRRGRPRGIFDGLVVYVNGSAHPHTSDHRLKRVLAENGARMSVHLGRRQVTHVILGRPAAAVGAGGGLAGGKLEKEILRTRGCGIKVLESVKAGRRLPEAGFSSLKIAPSGQQSVYGAFSRAATSPAPAAAVTTKGDTRTHNGS
ncbi:hypothetical protein RB594_001592 [Gaeumannomyces avenae]